MQREGVICGGCWLVDNNNSILNWPEEETLTTIVERGVDGGGPAHNMAMDLSRLGAKFPIWGMGAIGNDDAGKLILKWCAERKIDSSRIRVLSGVATSFTDVMTVANTGKRTFFHFQGANAQLAPTDFDFDGIPARILHIGAPGIHAKLDSPFGNEPSGWVEILKRARASGLRTNLEMISSAPDEIRRLVGPCLAHLDSVIINDYEAGALTGIDVVTGGQTSVSAAKRAAVALLEKGPIKLAVIHFPGGCVAANRDGQVIAHPSLQVPPAAIKGANGAGDAFAAGVLYGLHEDWALEDSLKLGLCSAASALRSVSTTGAVGTKEECLALATDWGWRAPL